MDSDGNFHSGESAIPTKMDTLEIQPQRSKVSVLQPDFWKMLPKTIPDFFRPIHKTISYGRFGHVYLSVTNANCLVTRKIRKNDKCLEQEAKLYSDILRSPYILRFISYEKDNGWGRLDTETHATNLQAMIDGGKVKDFKEIDRILYELAAALYHVHEKGWIHNDVKPANVLFTINLQVKLANFDHAIQLGGSHTLNFESMEYLPPECSEPWIPDDRKDVWSYAVCALQLVLGNSLKPTDINDSSAKDTDGNTKFGWKDLVKGKHPIHLTAVIIKIFNFCLVSVQQRPSMYEVLSNIFPLCVMNDCWMFHIVRKTMNNCLSSTGADGNMGTPNIRSNAIDSIQFAIRKENEASTIEANPDRIEGVMCGQPDSIENIGISNGDDINLETACMECNTIGPSEDPPQCVKEVSPTSEQPDPIGNETACEKKSASRWSKRTLCPLKLKKDEFVAEIDRASSILGVNINVSQIVEFVHNAEIAWKAGCPLDINLIPPAIRDLIISAQSVSRYNDGAKKRGLLYFVLKPIRINGARKQHGITLYELVIQQRLSKRKLNSIRSLLKRNNLLLFEPLNHGGGACDIETDQ